MIIEGIMWMRELKSYEFSCHFSMIAAFLYKIILANACNSCFRCGITEGITDIVFNFTLNVQLNHNNFYTKALIKIKLTLKHLL